MLPTLAALGDANRLRIVECLREGAKPAGSIVAALGLSQPLVSKHLRVLREAELVTVTPRGQQRVYELRPDGFRALDAWLENYRALWAERLDQLDDVPAASPPEAPHDDPTE